MEWEKISKKYAEEYYDEMFEDKEIPLIDYENKYQDLRILIKKAYKESLIDIGVNEENLMQYKNIYKFDCIFGIRLYHIFSDGKYEIRENIASDDGIWRYIQMFVVPEIISSRWGIENRDRFYKISRRLYLKILWWYVYLAWNENLEETKRIIMDDVNTSDTLAQLVERSGRDGYRIELYREIMKRKVEEKINTQEFRRLMVLNSARVKIINPYLVDGGISQYVNDLIKDIRG